MGVIIPNEISCNASRMTPSKTVQQNLLDRTPTLNKARRQVHKHSLVVLA